MTIRVSRLVTCFLCKKLWTWNLKTKFGIPILLLSDSDFQGISFSLSMFITACEVAAPTSQSYVEKHEIMDV